MRTTIRRTGPGNGNALVLLVVMGLVVALFRLHVFEPSKPLYDANVVGCDGRSVQLSGAQAELLRLHNEAREEHGLGTFCASERAANVRGHRALPGYAQPRLLRSCSPRR